MADIKVSWLAFDTAATPVDVKVSWLAFDTDATPVDVKVSWIELDTDATPVDVKVSWIAFDTDAQTDAGDGGKPRRTYVKRGKKYLIFDSIAQADAFLEAEQAIERAQRTSRRARKRLRDRVYKDAPTPIEIESGELALLILRFSLPFDVPAILAGNDIDAMLLAHAAAMMAQDEEDIEMLLLA